MEGRIELPAVVLDHPPVLPGDLVPGGKRLERMAPERHDQTRVDRRDLHL
jgi:hypothetical protein